MAWEPIPQGGDAGKKFWADRVAADPVNAYAVQATAGGSDPNRRAQPMAPAPTGTPGGAPPLPGGQAMRGTTTPTTTAGPAAGPPSQEGVLSGAGYQEDWYKNYGDDLMSSPSASEDLYSKGAAGSNPFYDNAQKETIKALNDQAAARGNFNSSYTGHEIGREVASLRGMQAHELGQLAGQSDRARESRYGLGNEFAGGAQRATENRVTGGANAYTNLADKQAGRVSEFYGPAGKSMNDAEMAAIEAQLKNSGMDSAQIQMLMNALGEFGGAAIKGGG